MSDYGAEESWRESCDSSDVMQKELEDLAKLLRADGTHVLDDTCKLSLSASLLRKINNRSNILQQQQRRWRREMPSADFLCDFMRRTRALKLCDDDCHGSNDEGDEEFVDLRLFDNLRLLELHRLSVLTVKGLEALRSQIEYVKCVRSVNGGGVGGGLQEMLEGCGADKATGYAWRALRGAVFRHNRLVKLDGSLRLAPHLESLDVSYNRIGDNIGPLICLPKLKHLNLANNRIASLKTLRLTVDLQVLILRNNLIDDIEQLSGLDGLRELDLRCNCLWDFDSLLPLSKMPSLRRLSLLGNPLSCDPNYRSKTCRYLNVSRIRTLSSPPPDDDVLLLDDLRLNEQELQNIGSYVPTIPSSSSQSQCVEQAFDDDDDITAEEHEESSVLGGGRLRAALLLDLQIQMQDSGFVADQRPVSPSQSIGSVGSLMLEHEPLMLRTNRYSGSDIEILSNPSQSSIEVLQQPMVAIPPNHLQRQHFS
ncbi:PREDICTED: serine/threonine-protein kinase 11-interacting protein-like [Nicrophorus vespilloides]|uniref:Serine/threonine-protein kinase 11-interacting protein-like n=1 Tax=Nicrophorus vespilloides TaxID=110193 RepID=A0ABM1NJN8_NICVS|nr:PREDICTED: serine/threonine-protein kinase 11-interacting protein-like [Nicrophorus vespilloides]